MKDSLDWIKKLIPELKASPAAIEKKLNATGTEVAAIENPADELKGVVVGEGPPTKLRAPSDEPLTVRVRPSRGGRLRVAFAPRAKGTDEDIIFVAKR